MRKPTPVLAALVVWVCEPVAFSKEFHAEEFNIDVRVQHGNVVEIAETTVFNFTTGTFTTAFRNIRWPDADRIEIVEASVDGERGGVQITGSSSPVRVRWRFAPTANATRTVRLRYRVHGAVRQTPDGDALLWPLLPNRREYRVQRSEVTLRYPAPPVRVSIDGADRVDPMDGSAVAVLSDIPRRDDPMLTALFPAGSLIGIPPRWQQSRSEYRSGLVKGLLYGGLAGLLILALAFQWLGGLPSRIEPGTNAGGDPPFDLPPTVAAFLAGRTGSATGLLADLARRGVLSIEATSGFWGRKFQVTRTDKPERLSEHERVFLETAFGGGESQADMSGIAVRVRKRWGAVSNAVWKELDSSGYVDGERRRLKQHAKGFALSALAASLVLIFIAVVMRANGEALGIFSAIGGAAMVVAIWAAVKAANLEVWTLSGAQRAAEARAFLANMKELSRARSPHDGLDFDRWLPYAAALGVGVAFSKAWQRVPAWYPATAGGDGGEVASFLLLMNSSDTSFAAGADGGSDGGGGGDGGAD